jgi:hypothetical protein
VEQRQSLSERVENGLGSHRVQIIQGCLGLGKTYFLHHWAEKFKASHPDWNIRFFALEEKNEAIERTIFEAAQRDNFSRKRVLYLIDNIERISHFSVFINSMNSLVNISCIATADLDIRVTKKTERTLFADRCVFLDFVPLSYDDYLTLIKSKGSQKNKVSDYLLAGGIPSVLLAADPKRATEDLRNKILLFVQSQFHLDDLSFLARLFDSFCRFGGFPKNQYARELSKDELKFSYNTLLKYTRALSACFAISELPRVNADNFTHLSTAPTHLPLDSCFHPSALSFDLRLIDAVEIALYNRLIVDGCTLSVSVVNRQKSIDGKRQFKQIENGFLVSKNSRVWFVIFSWDDGASGKEAMKELRNGFPKIIVVLPDVPSQMTSEGFYLVSLSTFLRNGLDVIKTMI